MADSLCSHLLPRILSESLRRHSLPGHVSASTGIMCNDCADVGRSSDVLKFDQEIVYGFRDVEQKSLSRTFRSYDVSGSSGG